MPLGDYPRSKPTSTIQLGPHPVTVTPAVSETDPLTSRPRSLKIFTSGQISDANDHDLAAPTATQVVRLRSVWVIVTGNAAQSNAGVLTVQVDDNGSPTGINVPVFVPGAAATTLGAVIVGPIDLGEGYVSKQAGAKLTVAVSAALSAGKIVVMATGNFE